ncbi:hypothetical protein EKO27_g7018 [Xylaria grammica]|uniref:Presequence translocated-associated motor subunit PAM17 n=1 Tax=Xylaria grammica TaxID=363999 RepID=A0A439D1D5_9PEZI|nr:hypothetical protein EKO27_g7018 [Xylaria grammica]
MRCACTFKTTLNPDLLPNHPKINNSPLPVRRPAHRHHGIHSELVGQLTPTHHAKARLERLLPAAQDAAAVSARQQHSDDGHRRHGRRHAAREYGDGLAAQQGAHDPIFALGIITFSFAGLGWLAGPSLGSTIFYIFKRGVKRPMALKESEFFNRIKKNRVDPTNSSLSGNAVPDFYGEKISSVAGYRQWLKDQRAFNKKRTSFV